MRPAENEPECFYHGLALSLLARPRCCWALESNRKSGYGRYDVAFVLLDSVLGADHDVVMEFEVFEVFAVFAVFDPLS